jgi:ATP/maltotriose-dependent transcriptional regulator MalT
MGVLAGVFKRIQLFFFAFTLASSSLMFVGMASGKLDRGVAYMGLAEKFARYFESNTALMDMFVGSEQVTVLDARPSKDVYRASTPSISHIQDRQTARSSLQALKQRQRQRIIVTDGLNIGG